jgi:UTP--glucose-1-phosphate uridylyltransferase
MKVDKAIIPAIGLGQRLLPATRVIPKELLPVGGKPMIQCAIEDAYDAGIRQIGIVMQPFKKTLQEYFTRSASGSHEALKRLNRLLQQCEIVFIQQREAHSTGEALLRCRDFVGDRPFALLTPDHVFMGKRSAIRQLVPHASLGMDLIGLYRLNPEIARWFSNSGRLEANPFTPSAKNAAAFKRLYSIRKMYDRKRGPFQMGKSKSLLIGIGRMILFPHIFTEIERAARDSGEAGLDDISILQMVIQTSGMTGLELEGMSFDVGNPVGYAAANWWMANR